MDMLGFGLGYAPAHSALGQGPRMGGFFDNLVDGVKQLISAKKAAAAPSAPAPAPAPASVPAAAPSAGIPTWVWIAGAGVVGVGLLLLLTSGDDGGRRRD